MRKLFWLRNLTIILLSTEVILIGDARADKPGGYCKASWLFRRGAILVPDPLCKGTNPSPH